MFFEADLNNKHYKVDVTEDRYHWRIKMQSNEEGGGWVHYEISKDDYKLVENSISLIFAGASYILDVLGSGTEYNVYTRGAYRNVHIYDDEALLHESLKSGSAVGGGEKLTSGMPGKISKVFVEKGQEVEANQPLLIMEAMKMENEMRTTHKVVIKDVLVKPGDSVESGQDLITFEPIKKK